MIPEVLEDLFFEDREDFIIPAKDVAVLRTENHLYHAMLILSNNYTTLPVLDEDDRVAGVLTMAAIVRSTTTITGYDMDKLNGLRVKDVMEPPVPQIMENAQLEDVLRELTNANFLCVVDDEGRFCGIVTRREVMARVSRCFHALHRAYEFVPKPRRRYKKNEDEERNFVRQVIH